MRIDQLSLVRYGKFTDRILELPRAERDFHVIVGPNEAGKSTVRAAILDLLYGIQARTPYAFVHAMPDLRLAARIEHGVESLAFQRVKANSKTLRDVSDGVLPDSALASYLGATDRDFFEQMFGLDHDRLVEGGQGILAASDDIGQILFQSAAGIASLGAVRQSLETEADALWTNRRSKDRAYYVAAEELERATAALKEATVRARDWSEALARVDSLDRAHDEIRRNHAGVRARRSLLERVRRILPHLNALDDVLQQADALGDAAELPDDAASTLVDAERAIAAAQAEIDHQTAVAEVAQAALKAIVVDEDVLALDGEIAELDEQRSQYRAYEGDIARRQAEIAVQWGIATMLARGLGWTVDDESTVRARLPATSVRAATGKLLHARATVLQASVSAERAETAKRAELGSAQAELDRLSESGSPLALQAALSQAQKLGDSAVVLAERRAMVRRREAAVGKAREALGRWQFDIEALQRMSMPDAHHLEDARREQVADDAQGRTLGTRLRALEQQADGARTELARYRDIHRPVTTDDVISARSQRNETWVALKEAERRSAERDALFEQQVAGADALADRRYDKVQESGELAAKQAHLERLEHDIAAVRVEIRALHDAAGARIARWSTLIAQCGLPELPFEGASHWLDGRRAVLDAAEQLREARDAQLALEGACEAAAALLVAELEKLGRESGDGSLDAAIVQAEECVALAADLRGQRRTLTKQVADAQRDLAPLVVDAATARAAWQGWSAHWTSALLELGLPAATPVREVEDWLDATGSIDTALGEMTRIRIERIDKMRADLDDHARSAKGLASRIAPDHANGPAAGIVQVLVVRLAAATTARQDALRLRASLDAAASRLNEAMSRRGQAQAALAPLLQRAGVSGSDALIEAIERSDRRRRLQADGIAHEAAMRHGSDGLTLAQLREEVGRVDPASVIDELSSLEREDETLVTAMTDLATKKHAARVELDGIGGAADAARAEGQRQQALAKMAIAVERYLRVFTAGRLLRWSIERFREIKQGPMLIMASAIFAQLTSGSFERLMVDFDRDPPKLLGRRPDGANVDIERMSEGTRDQLFLALRLAALDMHVGRAHALPFIADDLFVNYDDRRSRAGLEALGELSRKTQVVFLTHHDHLLPAVRGVFGTDVNVISL